MSRRSGTAFLSAFFKHSRRTLFHFLERLERRSSKKDALRCPAQSRPAETTWHCVAGSSCTRSILVGQDHACGSMICSLPNCPAPSLHTLTRVRAPRQRMHDMMALFGPCETSGLWVICDVGEGLCIPGCIAVEASIACSGRLPSCSSHVAHKLIFGP